MNLVFFSADNLNKSTNGTNYVGIKDAGVKFGYVWVYLNQHSIQPNVSISFEQIYIIEKTTTGTTCCLYMK